MTHTSRLFFAEATARHTLARQPRKSSLAGHAGQTDAHAIGPGPFSPVAEASHGPREIDRQSPIKGGYAGDKIPGAGQ